MALMIVLSGVVTLAIGVLGYLMPSVREVETLLPDHEPQEATAAT